MKQLGRISRARYRVVFLAVALTLAQFIVSCTLGGTSSTPLPPSGGASTATNTATDAVPVSTVTPVASAANAQVSPSGAASRVATPGTTVPTSRATPTVPTPRGAQTLTIAGGRAPDTLDPALVGDVDSAFLAHQIFRGLVRLDGQLQPVPDLAARIDVSSDALTYTFTLRDNATFQDGKPITAEDVRYSLERATDRALAGSAGGRLPGQTYLNDIAGAAEKFAGKATQLRGLTVVDARTIRITLDAPKVYFLMKLSHPVSSIVDRANVTSGGAWWRKPNGSGPFSVSSLSASSLVLKRYDRYYGGAPILETVTVLLGQAAGEPMNLYEGGKIDFTQVPVSSVDRVLVANSPLRAQLTVTPSLSLTYIGFNVTLPPFDDPAVRRAFAQALDREKIIRVTLGGKAVLAGGIVPPDVPGGPWNGNVLPYDLTAARAELQASRYGATIPKPLIYGASGSLGVIMRGVYARDLQVQLEVIAIDWPEYLQGLSARRYPAFEISWIADYPDPENFLAVLFGTGGGENYTGYRNPAVDRLLASAAVETDPGKRRQLYLDAQQLILNDAVVIPVSHSIDYTLVKPYVKGLVITSMGILELDRVWIER